ncbi:MAG TPA: hypothetical protein VF824_11475 [Thermoanaerobaculia bacterium]
MITIAFSITANAGCSDARALRELDAVNACHGSAEAEDDSPARR